MAAVGQKNFTVKNPEAKQHPSSPEKNYPHVLGYDFQTGFITINPNQLTEIHWSQKTFPVRFSSSLSGWTPDYRWDKIEFPEKDQSFKIAQDILDAYLSSKKKTTSTEGEGHV